MARSHGRVLCSIWQDDDFVKLSADAQRMYLFLLSQPQLNLVGVIDVSRRRWASKWPGGTVHDVDRILDELEEARFVVIDHDTEELLIRTFVRHDNASAGPKYASAVISDSEAIQSPSLRAAVGQLLAEKKGYQSVPDTPPDGPFDTPSDAPSDTPSHGASPSSGQEKKPKPNTETEKEAAAEHPGARGRTRISAADRKQRIAAAAAAISELRGKPTEARTKDNPTGWLEGALRGIVTELRERGIDELITGHPDWTAEQLADELEPAEPARIPQCGVCGTEYPTNCGDNCPIAPTADVVDFDAARQGVRSARPPVVR